MRFRYKRDKSKEDKSKKDSMIFGCKMIRKFRGARSRRDSMRFRYKMNKHRFSIKDNRKDK